MVISVPMAIVALGYSGPKSIKIAYKRFFSVLGAMAGWSPVTTPSH